MGAGGSDDNEDADDDEELDDLRDLSDDGRNQEQAEPVEKGEQPSSRWKGGKAESGTKKEKADDERKDIPAPFELSSDGLKPEEDGKQKRRTYPCSDENQAVDGGASRQEGVASTTLCDSSAGVAATASAAVMPDASTDSISHQQQQRKASEVLTDNPSTGERVEDDGRAQHHPMQELEGESERCPREDNTEAVTSTKGRDATEAMGTYVAEADDDTGVCVGEDGHGNGCDTPAGNSDGGDGTKDQQQDETAEGSLQGSEDDDGDGATNDMNALSDGNPDDAVEVKNPADLSTETLPVPPPPAIGSEKTDSVIPNQGAAAAMKCEWLPITLPPSPPSIAARQMRQEVKPLAPGEGEEAGLVPSPQAEIEALESPQDTALLQRKADRDPCRN